MSQSNEAVLDDIRHRFLVNPGRLAKQTLHHVTDVLGTTDWVTGPGDDTAVIPGQHDNLLAAGEAMFPPFVAADPFGAGVGAVIANVNDVAAMGGVPLALVDTLVAPAVTARAILAGLRHAAELYGVPVVGGHLTIADGEPSLSAFIVGSVRIPLLASNAAPGHVLLMAACLEGQMREDFPFFPAYEQRGRRVRGDLAVLPQLAERGLCAAAKDISMAGILGTLAMLLQPSGSGAVIQLEQVPRPVDVPLRRWLDVFPSYGFLLSANPANVEDCIAAFGERDIACSAIGAVDATGQLRARLGSQEAPLLADTATHGTGLGHSLTASHPAQPSP